MALLDTVFCRIFSPQKVPSSALQVHMQFGCSLRTPLITTTLPFLLPSHAVLYWLQQFFVLCSVISCGRLRQLHLRPGHLSVSHNTLTVCLCIDHVCGLYVVWLTWMLPWGLLLFFCTGALQSGVLQVIPQLFPSSVLGSYFFTDSFNVRWQSTPFLFLFPF